MKRLAILCVLTLCAMLAPVTPAGAQDSVRTPPSSIAADCSKDVGGALQGWVAGLPNGSTGQLKANGCYLVTSKIGIVNKTGITLDGNGATIRKKPDPAGTTKTTTAYPCNGHTGHFQISNASGITIKHVRLEGLGTFYAEFGDGDCHYAEHAIEILGGAVNVHLEQIVASRVRGDGLYVAGVNGLVAKDYVVESNGRQGGAVAIGTNILLDGFKVLNSSRSGWDFECNSNTKVLDNIEIRNFEIHSHLIAFPAQGYACQMTNINIHNGVVKDALSFVYDRQVRPSQDNCGGNRGNWQVSNVVVDPKVGSYGPGSAVFCNTKNVSVRNLTMPNGFLVFERSTGQLVAQNNCVKEVRVIEPSPALVQSGNTKPPCSGTPPPPTTKPPVTTTPTTGTTSPPVTTTRPPATTTPPNTNVKVPRAQCRQWISDLEAERARLRAARTGASEATLVEIKAAVRLSDKVHDELDAIC